jgi:cytochrome c556
MHDLAHKACIAAVIGIAFLVPVRRSTAHESATGITKERMDAMEDMAQAMKKITQAIKANRNLATIKGDARAIHDLAEKITSLFPPGSNQHPSGAKPAIWQKWSDFEAKASALALQSEKLANTDARDPKSIAAQVRAVSETCSGCHDSYRTKMPKHEHR